MHGQEVPFHCLFGLVFVRLRRIWASQPFSCPAPPLNSCCLSGRPHGVCAFCNDILLPQDGAFCSEIFCFVMFKQTFCIRRMKIKIV